MAKKANLSTRRSAGSLPSPHKAGEMLKHGEVGGNPLTPAQKGLFGAIRGGAKITRLRKRRGY